MIAKREWWYQFCIDAFASGSRVICDPAPTDTDEDFLCLVDVSTLKAFEDRLILEGFKIGGSGQHKQPVWHYRKRISNVWQNQTTGELLELEVGIYPPEDQTWNCVNIIRESVEDKPQERESLLEFPDFLDTTKTGVFRSWKKDDLNLILTCSTEYYDNFYKATKLASRLNLLDKSDRIALFEAVCFDNWDSTLRTSESKSWSWSTNAGAVNIVNNNIFDGPVVEMDTTF